MLDYPMQPGASKPPKISRVNWTQTTTITLAAFVGCLLALAACVLVYKYMLSKTIRVKHAELDRLDNLIDDRSHRLVRAAPPVTAKPAPVAETVDGKPAEKLDDEPETPVDTQKPYVPKVMNGTPIETTKAV